MMNVDTKPICIGTGLVALDVIMSGISGKVTQFLAGGSCGNVLTILAYLGWDSYPIARLSNNIAAELLLEDLHRWNVTDTLLSINETGSTPVIIHRILTDRMGIPKHRFEFRNPEDGKHLPAYKPCLAKDVHKIYQTGPRPKVFFFDRINRGAIELAKLYKEAGAVIFFEPSSIKDEKGFNECIEIADVIKFSDDRIPLYEKYFESAKVPLEIQTMGAKGLKFRMIGSSTWTYLRGYYIENVVDSAGAGDWCTAGIIYNLFHDKTIKNLTIDEVSFALDFGQALSALNCTFEGARGLMYHFKSSELLSYIQFIIESEDHRILERKGTEQPEIQTAQMKISSLLARV
ncbi:PfkB family carbohydrate kinase [Mucilaginibacter celer]|uniref:Carbohydrate kinase n=1 Tax=Mucilaginibacter celer TaxID=2305508 RepID=A0A494VLA1_9SPHI|nr:PfkB family carbohydrate kinase [Mucilaginibacter celer]AYL95294.1 carbohydrate kinase [Mucilaginibacter celer]